MAQRTQPAGTYGSNEALFASLAARPDQAVLVIDERRFGRDRGFDEERILFAGVLTTVQAIGEFGVIIENVRQMLDAQKRHRPFKSADVLRGRFAAQLSAAVSIPLSSGTVSYWATTQTHLQGELRARQSPAAELIGGGVINGPETPVIDMISGFVAQFPSVQALGHLEVFVDRSRQNGLHQPRPDDFWVYDLNHAAPALHDGKQIRLGAGVTRRLWALSEETRGWGDILLLADIAAHLWGNSSAAVALLREPRLRSDIWRVGEAPGRFVLQELELAFRANAASPR